MIKGGANLVQLRPVFSSDGKFMLICSGCSIRVLSVATGLLVTKLEGHSDQVTSIVVVPFPRNVKSLLTHAWTSSMDGTVRLWNFSSGVQIKCVNVGMPIKSMVIPELSKLSASQNSKKLGLIAFLSVYWKNGNRKSAQNDEGGRVILQNLTTGTSLMGSIAKVTYAQDLVVSPSGGLVGMADHRKLWIWRVPITPVDNVNAVKVTLLHHVKDIEVIAFDPTDTVVACGDHTGRMLVWRNVGDFTFSPNKVAIEAYRNSKKQNVIQENGSKSGVRGQDDASSCTTYHWHAHAIRSLTFTADGTHLLSGGMEAVLVIWQLDSGKREFLPRLGAPLLHIASSPDPSLFAVCCEDNSIKLVNLGSRTVEKSIQGIKPIASLSKNIEVLDYTRVAIEPQGGRVVFPTMNSTLQFYDVLHDRHVTEVQVAPRNFIFGSSISKGASEASTFVTHVTFSADGSTMATADSRLPEEDIGATSCLKFWTTDANMLHYSINTLVDEPHSAEISALVYHPEDDMAVSCSPAGDFKIWVQNKRAQGVAGWRCRSVGSYRQKRMLAAAFSPDGTLLAVAAEEVVTLWNPISNGFICVLSLGPPLQPIMRLYFVYNSKHLVTASYGDKPQLLVWNLETLSLWWSYHLNVEAIAVDPSSSCFAVMASSNTRKKTDHHEEKRHDGVVSLFSGDNPSPLAIWKIKDGAGGALTFMAQKHVCYQERQGDDLVGNNNSAHSNLVVLTRSGEFIVFDPHSQESSPKSVQPVLEDSLLDKGPSAFAAMYGQVSAHQQKKDDLIIAGIKDTKPWGDLLNVPSHVLPPLSKIGYKVLESFLQKQSTQ